MTFSMVKKINHPTGINDQTLASKLGHPTYPKYKTSTDATINPRPNTFFICLSPSSFAYLVTILIYVVIVTDKKEVQRTSRFYRLKTIFDRI